MPPSPECAVQLNFPSQETATSGEAEQQLPATGDPPSPASASAAAAGGYGETFIVVGPSGHVKYLTCAPPPSGDDDDDDAVAEERAFVPGSLLGGATVVELAARCREKAEARLAELEREEEARAKAVEAERKQARRLRRAAAEPQQPAAPKTQLLVDKYQPEGYLDLTSSEDVNLTVLEWFKEWEPTVFGKKKKKAKVKEEAPVVGAPPPGKKRRVEEKEPDTRPEFKILLVSGPPGAGKTTLASVIAKHCGYDAMQINASMDRTASSLDERISVSVTGAATLGDKPSCLILDEVDGIAHSSGPGGGVLAKLLRISATPWSEKGKKPLQLRPVVCICNNPWEKELRPLRAVAQHIKVDSVMPAKLVERLTEICRHEGVNAESSCLRELCTLSHGDIRSCLFTLQFLAQKFDGKRLTARQVSGVGLKDRIYSFFDVLETIFHADDAKAHAVLSKMAASGMVAKGGLPKVAPAGGGGGGGHGARLIRHMCTGHPEMERLLEGCFDEYTQASYPDYDMRKTKMLLRAVSTYDTFRRHAQETMTLGIEFHYAPQLLLTYHTTCRTAKVQRKKWQLPQRELQVRRRIEKTSEIVDTHLFENATKRQWYPSRASFILDYLTPFVAILNPVALRTRGFIVDPASAQAFNALVNRLAEEKVSFQEVEVPDNDPKTPWGSTKKVLKFLPDLESVVFYGKKHRAFRPLPEDMRTKLFTAVKNASIIRAAAAANGGAGGGGKKSLFGAAGDAAKAGAATGPCKADRPSAIAGLAKKGSGAAAPAVRRVAVKRDMFGNIIPSKEKKDALKKKADLDGTGAAPVGMVNPLASHPMFDLEKGCKYEQNQGFTNAVRKKGSWSGWL